MTLSLEQVRQTRFHLARRNGYEPVDVDNFVDKVEATLSQLSEENEGLRQQVEALSSSQPSPAFVPGDSSEANRLRGELQARADEVDGLRAELQQRQGELEHLRSELQGREDELNRLRGELDGVRHELDTVRQAPAEGAEPQAPTGKVDNIVVTSAADAAPAVTRLLQMATEQAERLVGESQVESQRLVAEARGEAESVVDGANRAAHETITDARTRADRIESEARVNAERLSAEAQARSEAVNQEIDQRRAELFTAMEQERDVLRGRVEHLRAFEGNFRSNLTAHLHNQIRILEEAVLEPGDTPDILNEPAQQSATPRLDALLNEQG